MSTNDISCFDIFIDEELVHPPDVEDEESHTAEELRLETQRISAQSRANRERNVSTGLSSNEEVPGYVIDDPHVVFNVRALLSEAFTLLRGLPDTILRRMKLPNPAKPSLVFEYAAVRAKFETLSEDDFLKLSPAEVLSKEVDILAKAYAIIHGENSLKNICGGANENLNSHSSNYIVRGVFLVMKISPTEEDAILFANSDKAEGGRKRAQEMKLLADIEARRKRDKNNCVLLLVKVSGRIVGKFPSILAASEAFYSEDLKRGTIRTTGSMDIYGANFSEFLGSEEQFVALPMAHDHADQLAKLIDERLLQISSTEIMLSRQGTTLGPFANKNTGKLISSNPILSWPTSHFLSILLKCLHFRRWTKTNI